MSDKRSAPFVEAALDEARELETFVRAQQPASFSANGRNHFAVALCSMALDHRAAVVLLVSEGWRSSAAALCSSIYEDAIRGMWAHFCATGGECHRAFVLGHSPKVETMARKLAADGLGDSILRSKRQLYDELSDFAHGGHRQVMRWIGPEGIEPRHTDADVIRWLHVADVYTLLACTVLAQIAEVDQSPYKELWVTVSRAYVDRKDAMRVAGEWGNVADVATPAG